MKKGWLFLQAFHPIVPVQHISNMSILRVENINLFLVFQTNSIWIFAEFDLKALFPVHDPKLIYHYTFSAAFRFKSLCLLIWFKIDVVGPETGFIPDSTLMNVISFLM